MRLRNLFNEESHHPPLSPSDEQEILNIIKSFPWQVTVLNVDENWKSHGDVDNITPTSSTKSTKASGMTLHYSIGRSTNTENNNKFYTLKKIYHPDLDKPKVPTPPPVGFHDEDTFKEDEDPELYGYEFIIDGRLNKSNNISILCQGFASVFDTTEQLELPKSTEAWMKDFYIALLKRKRIDLVH